MLAKCIDLIDVQRRCWASQPACSLSQVLQSFLAQERVVEAHTLLNLLQQMAMPVDVVMYNLVMTGYKKKRLWQPVLQVRLRIISRATLRTSQALGAS